VLTCMRLHLLLIRLSGWSKRMFELRRRAVLLRGKAIHFELGSGVVEVNISFMLGIIPSRGRVFDVRSMIVYDNGLEFLIGKQWTGKKVLFMYL